MKKNYHINFDPPDISSERIQQHQDFDALLAKMEATQSVQEQAKPTASRSWLWIASAVAAALIGVIFWFNQEESITDIRQQYAQEEAEFFEERAFVNPPFENIQPTFAAYTVNARQGGSYTYGETSNLSIPTDAFQDENGVAVEGDVQLYYREMHDQADFFLSGIPMTYDSAGINYVLESAGMIEIYAEQNGKRVLMRPGKSIDIELASTINTPSLAIPPQYNIYRLHVADRKWEYQARNKMSWLTSLETTASGDDLSPQAQLEQEKAAALAQLEKKFAPVAAPEKPRSRNTNQPSIELDFLDSFEGSESAKAIREQYDGAIWQLSERSTLDRSKVENKWESVVVKDLGNEEYEITLSDATDQISFIVQPILPQKDYEKAIAEYEDELLRYEQLTATSKELLATEKAALEARYAQRLTDLQSNDSFTNTSPSEKRRIVNTFKANQFGIWNCDRPLPPATQEAVVTLTDESGQPYENTRAYLMDYNRNSVQQIFVDETTVLTYDANTRQLLWIVLADNKIAVMQPEQFQELQQNTITEVVLEVLEQPMENEQDVRRAIKI